MKVNIFFPEKLLQNHFNIWNTCADEVKGNQSSLEWRPRYLSNQTFPPGFLRFPLTGKLILRVCLRRRRCGRKNFLFPSDEICFFSLSVHLNRPISFLKHRNWRMESKEEIIARLTDRMIWNSLIISFCKFVSIISSIFCIYFWWNERGRNFWVKLNK